METPSNTDFLFKLGKKKLYTVILIFCFGKQLSILGYLFLLLSIRHILKNG